MNEQTKAVSTPGVKNLKITVTYDNNPYKQGLETAWGFAAFITGFVLRSKATEKGTDPQPPLATGVAGAWKTILFDTGGRLLLDNMQKLAIEPDSIDVVVLSHIHPDHTGGLAGFLEKNPNVTVYLPKSFPKKFKDNVRDHGTGIVEVEESMQICENVYSTGQLGRLIKEQSLIIRTDNGLVIVIGCAHSGIVNIVSTAKELIKDDILLVMGGFHLEWATKGRIEKIISAFKRLGVRCVGPCHCSGHKARCLFEKHFGSSYINIGAGKVITLADLQ